MEVASWLLQIVSFPNLLFKHFHCLTFLADEEAARELVTSGVLADRREAGGAESDGEAASLADALRNFGFGFTECVNKPYV